MNGSGDLLFPNGVDALTGDYLLPPTPVDEFARLATAFTLDRASSAELAARHRRTTEPVFAPKHGVDPADLAQTGWGVVFADSVDPSVVAALTPLLERRRAQAGAQSEHRYREFVGPDGYRGGESKQDFLRRHGSGPGPVDPDVIPYYLLLVGGPDEIPFDVQYQLDVQHAVGRINFDDIAGYARYAANVVAVETSPPQRRPRLAFFAPRNQNDPATALSAEHLVTPLATGLANSAVQVRSFLGADASKDELVALLSGSERPDLLFTATHGLGFPAGHPDQRGTQGALVCQDWPGPAQGAIAAQHWFGARDIPPSDLTGLVAVLFACYGAGTPRHDAFDRGPDASRTLAPDPFVAALPQALLGREGGALAVVGHVDRALGYSFVWPGAGQQTEVYRSTLAELAAGRPIGSALEYVGDRYAEITTDLQAAVEDARQGWRADDAMLAGLWSACIDARGFVLLGDPAVRLTTVAEAPGGGATRRVPVIAASREPRAAQPTEHIGSEPVAEPEVLEPARTDPVEVATYVTTEPGGVGYDPATGGISGARLWLLSSVDLDGTAAHVATMPAPGVEVDPSVAELHARMVEISIAARRAHTHHDPLQEPEGAP